MKKGEGEWREQEDGEMETTELLSIGAEAMGQRSDE